MKRGGGVNFDTISDSRIESQRFIREKSRYVFISLLLIINNLLLSYSFNIVNLLKIDLHLVLHLML
jgi:hypothetical protein